MLQGLCNLLFGRAQARRLILLTSLQMVAVGAAYAQSSSVPEPTPIRQGLIAAYGFEESIPGVVIDSSPRPYQQQRYYGTFDSLNGPERVPNGRFGNALRFDGNDDWITISPGFGDEDPTTSLTVMAWVKATSAVGWQTVFMRECGYHYNSFGGPGPAGLTYALYSNDNAGHPAGFVYMVDDTQRNGSDYGVMGQQAIDVGMWTHLAFTLEDNQLRIYVNGILERATPVPDRITNCGAALRIGGNNVWGEYFGGVLDEIRLYNRALSLDEIRADMVTPVVVGSPPHPTSTEGLVAAYSFDDGTAYDASGYAHHGVIAGARLGPGRHGAALVFDGVDDLVSVSHTPALDLTDSASISAMTLEAWIWPETLESWNCIILKEAPSLSTGTGFTTSGLVYGLYANGFSNQPMGFVRVGYADRDVRGAEPLPTRAWTHLVVTYDGTTMNLWVNGVLRGSVQPDGRLHISEGALAIGGNTIWGEYFHGAIDNVRIYNRVLDIAEIQTNMETPIN